MKKLLLLSFLPLLLLLPSQAKAQPKAPQAFGFQAVVRNANQEVVANQYVSVRFSIINENPDNKPIFREERRVKTNDNGLFTLDVGGSSDFRKINWSSGTFFLRTEIDPEGGSNYSQSSTMQLLSVPYALFADQSLSALQVPSLDTNAIAISVGSIQSRIDSLAQRLNNLNNQPPELRDTIIEVCQQLVLDQNTYTHSGDYINYFNNEPYRLHLIVNQPVFDTIRAYRPWYECRFSEFVYYYNLSDWYDSLAPLFNIRPYIRDNSTILPFSDWSFHRVSYDESENSDGEYELGACIFSWRNQRIINGDYFGSPNGAKYLNNHRIFHDSIRPSQTQCPIHTTLLLYPEKYIGYYKIHRFFPPNQLDNFQDPLQQKEDQWRQQQDEFVWWTYWDEDDTYNNYYQSGAFAKQHQRHYIDLDERLYLSSQADDYNCLIQYDGPFYGSNTPPYTFSQAEKDAGIPQKIKQLCAQAWSAEPFSTRVLRLRVGDTVYAFNLNTTGTNSTLDPTFSVSASKKVYFSPGNLAYIAQGYGNHNVADGGSAQGYWFFKTDPFQSCDNSKISSSYSSPIDLFGWGTSGWNSGATSYTPYSKSTSYPDYYPGGSYSKSLSGAYANADWGVYNAIEYLSSNPSAPYFNHPGDWRTLSASEWRYLLYQRPNAANKLFYVKLINPSEDRSLCGLLLLPDNMDKSIAEAILQCSFADGTIDNNYVYLNDKCSASFNTWNSTYYLTKGIDNTSCKDDTPAQPTEILHNGWSRMNDFGIVFLPVTGYRSGSSIYESKTNGYYWSSSYCSSKTAYYMCFSASKIYPKSDGYRDIARAVRLVRDSQ